MAMTVPQPTFLCFQGLMSDLKRYVSSFLGLKEVHSAILFLNLSENDVTFYVRSQDVSVASFEEWKTVRRLCQRYGNVRSLDFHYEPGAVEPFSLPKECCTSHTVSATFTWKKMGIISFLKFVNCHKECQEIHVTLLCDVHWNFGVLCNLVGYQQNVFLTVLGFPVYESSMYVRLPCRMAHLTIVSTTPFRPETVSNIQQLTDHLNLVVYTEETSGNGMN